MAARYWVGGTANWDNTAGTKWSTTSGGAGGASAPTSADDVFFDANSGTNTITITSAANCKSINGTGATATLDGSATLTINGSFNIGGLTVTYTGIATISATGTLTSNGKTWTGSLTFTGTSMTYTLADNWTVNGTVTFSGGTAQTINGSTLICNGNLTSTTSSVYVTGTTNISMQGTSTIVGSNGGYAIDIEINTSGTITFTNTIYIKSGTWLHTSGTVNAGTSTVNHIASGAFILNCAGITFYNLILLSSDSITNTLNVSGTLTLSNTTLNTHNINVSGNLTIVGTCVGTSLIILNGTGTWSGSGTLRNNVTINTAGTLTIGTNIYYNTGTLTYTAGTVTTTGSTLNIAASTTLDTSSINWNNVLISISTNITLTLLSDFNITGTFDYLFSGANIILSFLGTGLFNPIGNFIIRQGGFFNGTINLPNTLNLKNFTASSITGFTTTINNYNINISGNLTNNNQGTIAGTTNLFLVGTGIWSNTIDGRLQNNLTINTSGTITFSSTVYYQIGTLTYLSGKIETSGNKFYLGTSTLINCHKINFNRVVVDAGTTLTMNEFFSGNPNQKPTISSTGSNYTILFQDGFEKISKFVNISGATISIRNQLLVITNSKKSSTNSGIRYINSSPNGIAKGDPSIQNILTPGLNTFLISDPNMNIK